MSKQNLRGLQVVHSNSVRQILTEVGEEFETDCSFEQLEQHNATYEEPYDISQRVPVRSLLYSFLDEWDEGREMFKSFLRRYANSGKFSDNAYRTIADEVMEEIAQAQ